MPTSVASVIGLLIEIAIQYIERILAYQYWIGTIAEKVADTDICIKIEIHVSM